MLYILEGGKQGHREIRAPIGRGGEVADSHSYRHVSREIPQAVLQPFLEVTVDDRVIVDVDLEVLPATVQRRTRRVPCVPRSGGYRCHMRAKTSCSCHEHKQVQ